MGTCFSVGCTVEGQSPQDVIAQIQSGVCQFVMILTIFIGSRSPIRLIKHIPDTFLKFFIVFFCEGTVAAFVWNRSSLNT